MSTRSSVGMQADRVVNMGNETPMRAGLAPAVEGEVVYPEGDSEISAPGVPPAEQSDRYAIITAGRGHDGTPPGPSLYVECQEEAGLSPHATFNAGRNVDVTDTSVSHQPTMALEHRAPTPPLMSPSPAAPLTAMHTFPTRTYVAVT